VLEGGIANRHLAIAGQHHLAATLEGQDGGRANVVASFHVQIT